MEIMERVKEIGEGGVKIGLEGARIGLLAASGAASKPATAPIIPSGNNTTTRTNTNNSTDNILIGNINRNTPVFKITENSFKKITTNITIKSTLRISTLHLSLFYPPPFTDLINKRCIY
jgi:hypothetical protein